MKTLTNLFEQIYRVYPHKLSLLDDKLQVIVSTNGGGSENPTQNSYTYPIKTQLGEKYHLMIETEIVQETLGILQILICFYLDQLQTLNKKQIIQHMIAGCWEENILKYTQKSFTNESTVYQLIWIETPATSDEIEFIQILEECFKGEKYLTLVPQEKGLLMLVEGEITKDKLVDIARLIRDMVNAELYIDVYVSISKTFNQLKEVKTKLIEAKKLMEIGKTFSAKSHIFIEDELNLEKTLFSISKQERQKIYNEIYSKAGYDEMDEEIHLTIETFLNNNMSLGETSKALFIHRNTLAYRLDRILKITGLDLRRFEDAMFFKIAMLLKRSL